MQANTTLALSRSMKRINKNNKKEAVGPHLISKKQSVSSSREQSSKLKTPNSDLPMLTLKNKASSTPDKLILKSGKESVGKKQSSVTSTRK